MKPGVDGWQPLISFEEINVSGIDLLDDAWGFSRSYPDVLKLLTMAEPVPPDHLVENLLSRIEQELRT